MLPHSKPVHAWHVSSTSARRIEKGVAHGRTVLKLEFSLLRAPVPELLHEQVIDMALMFSTDMGSGPKKKLFNQPLGRWSVGKITSLDGMFLDCPFFDQNINSWDTQRVKDMSHVFDGAVKFNSPLTKWQTSAVTSMFRMLHSTEQFDQDVGVWDVNQVGDFSEMFTQHHDDCPFGKAGVSPGCCNRKRIYEGWNDNTYVGLPWLSAAP